MTLTAYLMAFTPLMTALLLILSIGIHLRCRALLRLYIQQTHTKRAIKEAERAHTQAMFSGFHPLRALRDTLTMQWEMQLAGNDPFAGKLRALSIMALLLPLAGYCAVLSGRIPVVTAWFAAVLTVCESVLLLILMLRQRQIRTKKRDPHEHISLPALWLRYGWCIAALVLLAVDLHIPAALCITANGIHILIGRALRADHFYCAAQNIHRRPMTPHHHSDAFRRRAEREGLQTGWLVTGSGILYAIGYAVLKYFGA